MEILLRIVAVLVLVIGGVVAIEFLPQRGGLGATLGDALECVTRDHALAQAPAPAPIPGVGVQVAPAAPGAPAARAAGALSTAECQRFMPSFYAAVCGTIGSLLLGGFAALLRNTRRSREIMEQFASGASGGR